MANRRDGGGCAPRINERGTSFSQVAIKSTQFQNTQQISSLDLRNLRTTASRLSVYLNLRCISEI